MFTHTGFVNVVAPPYADALRKNVEMLRSIGINTVALSPGELRDLQPFANVEDLGAAAWEPESGYADPAATVEGFRRRGHELVLYDKLKPADKTLEEYLRESEENIQRTLY